MACPRDVLGKTCGGHGACMTLREAGAAWNGRNLVRPHAPYENNWDADKVRAAALLYPGKWMMTCTQRADTS